MMRLRTRLNTSSWGSALVVVLQERPANIRKKPPVVILKERSASDASERIAFVPRLVHAVRTTQLPWIESDPFAALRMTPDDSDPFASLRMTPAAILSLRSA